MRTSPLTQIIQRLDQVINLLTANVELLRAIHAEAALPKQPPPAPVVFPKKDDIAPPPSKIKKAFDFTKVFQITQTAYNEIMNSIGRRPAETGGILLSSHHDYVVDTFVFDTSAKTSTATYEPNVSFLRKYLSETDDHLIGVVHSHPVGYIHPSPPDIKGALNNIRLNSYLDGFLLPIIQTIPDTGKFSLHAYLITPGKNGYYERHELQVKIIPDRKPCKPSNISVEMHHESLKIPAD